MTTDDLHNDDAHDDFGGLQRDLPHLLGRRRALLLLGGGVAGLFAPAGARRGPPLVRRPRRRSRRRFPHLVRDGHDATGAARAHLAQLSLASDNVFRDGWDDQLATVAPAGDGYLASLLVRV